MPLRVVAYSAKLFDRRAPGVYLDEEQSLPEMNNESPGLWHDR